MVDWSDATASRFHEWFPNSAETFANTSAQICNATLQAFETAYDNHADKAWIKLGLYVKRPIYNLCKDHMSCILQHTSESEKVMMSTLGVILGLLPSLLAVLLPSISGLSMLSA